MTNSSWLFRAGVVGERTVGRASARLRLSARTAYVLLVLLMAGYALLFTLISFRLHDSFITSADDLSNIDQAVWNSWHGDLLIRTTGTRQLPRYGEHLEPIWIALGPLFFVWNDVKILLLVQTLALAAGALPAFWLGRAMLAPGRRAVVGSVHRGFAPQLPGSPDSSLEARTAANLAGLVLAAVYLLLPFLHRANIAEVHAAPFAVAPLLFAFWYASQGQDARVWPFALLVLLVKEEQALLVAMVGLWIAVRQRRPRAGLALTGLSLAWLLVAVFGIINQFAEVRTGTTQSVFFGRYTAFGETPAAIVVGFLTHPALVRDLFLTPERLRLLGELVASTGGVLLFGLDAAVLMLPLLVLNLASDYVAQAAGLQHYAAPLVPGLIAGAAVGGRRLLTGVGSKARPVATTALLLWMLASAAATALQAGFLPVSRGFWLPAVTPHDRMLDRFIAQIPPGAALSASRQLHPHVAHRRYVTRFPTIGAATWALVDVTGDRHVHPADVKMAVEGLLASGWGVVDAADGYLLLHEGAAATALPEAFFSFGRAQEDPDVPLDLVFARPSGEALLRVLGYSLARDFWGRVSVRYVLEPLAALPPGTTLRPLLLDPLGRPVADTAGAPLLFPLWYPLDRWRPGFLYAVETPPRDVRGQPFRPALGVAVGEGTAELNARWGHAGPVLVGLDGNTLVTLGEWQPAGARFVPTGRDWHRFDLRRAPEHPLAVRLGESVALRGWDGPTRTTDGQLPIRLVWQALAVIPRDLTVFVHLVPLEGLPIPVAQADHVPTVPTAAGLQLYPTTAWQPGELVLDEFMLDVRGVPPGRYRLLVGLYDPNSGARLLLTGGGEGRAVPVGEVFVPGR
ncbi:MAG TPA: hypothetical protein DEP84_03080 [Chloroflexi bacterium]|nr:hypothetical protein [Chloroflexota bacterium]